MSEFLYYVFQTHPDAFTIAFYVLVLFLSVFLALVFGSFRWWWIRRTRLPAMWKREREEYEAEIKDLTAKVNKLQQENGRLKTAAFGQVVMSFRSAVNVPEP